MAAVKSSRDPGRAGRAAEPLVSARRAGAGVGRAGPAAHFRQLVAILDGLALIVAFPLAYIAKTRWLPSDLTPLYDPSVYVGPAAISALAFVVFLDRRGAYRPAALAHLGPMLVAVLPAAAQALVVGFALLFSFKLAEVSRLFMALYGVAGTALVVSSRFILRRLVVRAQRSGAGAARVLIVGATDEAERIAALLATEAPFGVEIVGRVAPEQLGDGEETALWLASRLASDAIDEVVVVSGRYSAERLARLVAATDREGVALHVVAGVIGRGLERVVLEEVGEVRLLSLNPHQHPPWGMALKRLGDFITAPLLVVVLLPLWLVVALAIRLDSPGPVFFVQERLGLNKRRFWLVKFRSMVDGAERMQAGLEADNEASGPRFKLRRDPRVTRVGRWLRRFDLDETPQLLNVCLGQMSLVGPRPMLSAEVTGFEPWQRKRFSVLPGITGLWQVSHRLGDPFLSGLQADLDYIDRWSLGLDASILLRTLPAVLRERMAP